MGFRSETVSPHQHLVPSGHLETDHVSSILSASADGTSKPIYLVKLAKGQEIDIRMRAYKVSPCSVFIHPSRSVIDLIFNHIL